MLILLYCLLGLDGPVGWYVYLVDYLGEVLLLCGVLLLLKLLDLAVLPIIMLQSRIELPAVLRVLVNRNYLVSLSLSLRTEAVPWRLLASKFMNPLRIFL